MISVGLPLDRTMKLGRRQSSSTNLHVDQNSEAGNLLKIQQVNRVQQRRRRTGRNVQFNIRATQQVVDEFKALSEAQDWPDGLTLEKALGALKREMAAKSD